MTIPAEDDVWHQAICHTSRPMELNQIDLTMWVGHRRNAPQKRHYTLLLSFHDQILPALAKEEPQLCRTLCVDQILFLLWQFELPTTTSSGRSQITGDQLWGLSEVEMKLNRSWIICWKYYKSRCLHLKTSYSRRKCTKGTSATRWGNIKFILPLIYHST